MKRKKCMYLPAKTLAIFLEEGKVLYPSRFEPEISPPEACCLRWLEIENTGLFSSLFLGTGQNTLSAKSSNTVVSLWCLTISLIQLARSS